MRTVSDEAIRSSALVQRAYARRRHAILSQWLRCVIEKPLSPDAGDHGAEDRGHPEQRHQACRFNRRCLLKPAKAISTSQADSWYGGDQ